MAEERKPELEVGKEYMVNNMNFVSSVRGFTVVRAKYLGYGILNKEISHLFSFERNDQTDYFLRLRKDKDEFIECHNMFICPDDSISNSPIQLLKNKLKTIPNEERSQLLEILKQLGEQL